MQKQYTVTTDRELGHQLARLSDYFDEQTALKIARETVNGARMVNGAPRSVVT